MKRFVWRLQRVLNIKTKEEQIKKVELLKLTERLIQKRSELLTQKRVLEDIIRNLSEKEPDKRLSRQELFLRSSRRNDEIIKKVEKRVSELELQQREKTAEFLKLKRFKESMEKLREEAKMRFITEQEKLEQKELDESATIGFMRKMRQPLKL